MVRTKFALCILLMSSLCLFSAGILLLASGELLPLLFQLVICFGFLSFGILQLYRRAKEARFSVLGVLLAITGIALLDNDLFLTLFPVAFTLFLLLHLLIRAWDFLLYKLQRLPGYGSLVAMLALSLLPCGMFFTFHLFDSTFSVQLVLLCGLFYGLFTGLDRLLEAQNGELSLHHPFRLSPPLMFTALPYALIKFFPAYLRDEGSTTIPSDTEIFVHVADTKYGKLGHVDLYFDGNVVSFGSYDETARKLDGALGDGILFFSPNREEYLDFCKNYSHKTIIRFGLRLTEAEKQELRFHVAALRAQTEPWQPTAEAGPVPYARLLQQTTGACFYKFRSGRFKTYFILKTNCVKLCDTIIGSLGLQRPNGILTPGSYYAFLCRELRRPNSRVLYKRVCENTRKYF